MGWHRRNFDYAVGMVEVRSPRAARYFMTAPGGLGLARAYVMGDLEIHGDLHATLHNLLVHRSSATTASTISSARCSSTTWALSS